jgi:RNase P subunit RPR2
MKFKEVKCGDCRRILKKNEIREQQVWSKVEGKAKIMRVCKYCGSIIRENKR